MTSAHPLPVPWDVGDAAGWFVENPRSLTTENVLTAVDRVGREFGPELLHSLCNRGQGVPRSVLAAVVGVVWADASYPDRVLSRGAWLELFTAAGYTVDGVSADRPCRPLVLYRGSVEARRSDWSWTDDVEVARRFADGRLGIRPDGRVWTAVVEPRRLLARTTSRDESEYVVNTDGLEITEHVGRVP